MNGIVVLAFGAWDRGAGYPRGTSLLEGLRLRGARVVECRMELPYSGVAKRQLVAAPWKWPGYLWSMWRSRRRAKARLEAAIEIERPDVVLVPYPGHAVVAWARAVWRGPLVLDLFLSAYDTAVLDRRLFRAGSWQAKLIRRVDRRACAAADRVLLDTEQHAAFIADLLSVPREKLKAIPVSDPQAPAVAPPYIAAREGDCKEVLFFGTGVPLHGLSVLLDAVAVCENVRLTLIGGSDEDRARARTLPPGRLRLLERFISSSELQRELALTHLVAGVFGRSGKADRVIPFKVMHALSMGRPVITAGSAAAQSVFRDGRDAVLVPAGNAIALEVALCDDRTSPRDLAEIAGRARAIYDREFSLERVGERLVAVIRELLPEASDAIGRTNESGTEHAKPTSPQTSSETTELAR